MLKVQGILLRNFAIEENRLKELVEDLDSLNINFNKRV